jgi:Domain of unknown function (DUF397)
LEMHAWDGRRCRVSQKMSGEAVLPFGEGDSEGQWITSSASADVSCVAVAFTHHGVLVKHSKRPDGPLIEYTYAEWEAFLVGVRLGEFDPAGHVPI